MDFLVAGIGRLHGAEIVPRPFLRVSPCKFALLEHRARHVSESEKFDAEDFQIHMNDSVGTHVRLEEAERNTRGEVVLNDIY